MMSSTKSEIYGIKEVQKLFKQIDKYSVRYLTKSAKSGAKIALKSARANATVKTGAQKRGIKLKLESRKGQTKRVYRMGFFGQSGKGEEFVKYSSSGKRSFYPVSQEYGWVDVNGVRHEGKRFMRNAIDNNRGKIKNETLQTLGAELDKLR